VLIVWYLCSVPNLVQLSVIVTSEIHLMTSRKLTSGFDFWSCGHSAWPARDASAYKIWVHIFFIQSGVIDTFLKSKMTAFSGYVNLVIMAC